MEAGWQQAEEWPGREEVERKEKVWGQAVWWLQGSPGVTEVFYFSFSGLVKSVNVPIAQERVKPWEDGRRGGVWWKRCCGEVTRAKCPGE